MTRDEFREWVNAHRDLHFKSKLPEFEEAIVMYDWWRADLAQQGLLDRRVLDIASGRMVKEPPRAEKDHYATLLEYAKEARASRPGLTVRHDLSSREGALTASAGCERCSGSGLVTVWHPRPSLERKIPETVSAYCVCAYGRWVERNHSAKCPDVRKRMPDLADVLARRGVWLQDPPDARIFAAAADGLEDL